MSGNQGPKTTPQGTVGQAFREAFATYYGLIVCASAMSCSVTAGTASSDADAESDTTVVRARHQPIADAAACDHENYDACEGDDLELLNAPSVDTYHGVNGPLYTWLVGDVNGDGRDDLIRRHIDGEYNKVFLSRADATFSVEAPPLWSGSGSPFPDVLGGNNALGTASWLAADVNGDGATDLVRRSVNGSSNLVLLSQMRESGRFLRKTATDTLSGADGFGVSWHVGDFDGDGKDDLVRRAADGLDARVLLGKSDGKFRVLASAGPTGAPEDHDGYSGDGQYLWLVGDFDGDGRDDLMRRAESGTGNALMLSRYTPTIPPGSLDNRFQIFENIDTYTGGYDTRRWFVGDLDGDGDADLARRDHGGTFNKVMFSKGDGTFRTAAPRYADGTSEVIGGVGDGSGFEWHSGDFDGDGRMDLTRRSTDGAGNLVILSRYLDNGVDGHEVVINATDSAGFVSDTEHTWLTADVNGDSHTDLVRRNRIGEDNRVLAASFASLEVIFRPGESCDSSYADFRIPALVTAPDGTLLAFAEGRDSNEDFGDIDVVLRRSSDRGATWSDCDVVCNGNPADSVCGNPTPVVDMQAGKVWLFMNFEPHDAKADGEVEYGERRVWFAVSDDNGQDWVLSDDQTATLLPKDYWDFREGGMQERGWDSIGPGRGIQKVRGAQAGRLIVPAQYRNIYSDDHGATWQVELRNAPTHGLGVEAGFTGESSIVELSDGSLMRNDRPIKDVYEESAQNKRRWVARASFNAGAWSWTNFDPDPLLLDPGCEASVLDLSEPNVFPGGPIVDPNAPVTKRRLLFLNSASTATRRKMLIRISNDDGLSWPLASKLYPELTDDEGKSRGGYSVMTAIDRQTIGVLTEFNELTPDVEPRSLAFRRLNLTWIAGGPSNY